MRLSVTVAPLCVAAALLAASPTFSQTAPVPAGPSLPANTAPPQSASSGTTTAVPLSPAAVVPPAESVPAGTVVEIEITQSVNSRENKSGDKFTLQLASPLVLAGRVVIPAGTTGVGEVIDAEPSGFAGRAGKIVLAARYLDFEGRRVPLKAFKVGGEGRDNANLATAVVIAAGFPGMFIHGGNITYTVGARANAKLAADFTPAGVSPPQAAAPPANTSGEGKLK